MFSYLFGELGKQLTNNLIGNKALSYIASGAASYVGRDLDHYILSSNQKTTSGKIDSFSISQTICYGIDIPIIFGRASISGNIIWLGGIKEDVRVYQEKYGAIFKRKITRNEYCYLADFAVAVCQGEAKIVKIFADNNELNIDDDKIRIYSGSESQLPNPTIASYEGINKTPAFRGLCYVVFKDFPLDDFGNFPKLFFQVEAEIDTICTVEAVKFRSLANEFSLDTNIIFKYYFQQQNGFKLITSDDIAINQIPSHNQSIAYNWLNKTREKFQLLQWIEIEIFWYLEIINDQVSITPMITEKEKNCKTKPYEWSVAGFSRDKAKFINPLVIENAISTQNDQSLKNFYNLASQINFKISLKISLRNSSNIKIEKLIHLLNDRQKTNLIESFNAVLNHYTNLAANDGFDLGNLESIIPNEIKQKISLSPKLNFIDHQITEQPNQGFYVSHMLNKILAKDLAHYQIDTGNLAYQGLVIRNLNYGELLLRLSVISNIEFFTIDGIVNIRNLEENKIPAEADSEIISYQTKNYVILYSNGQGSVNKHFIIDDFNYDFASIEIPFIMESPGESFAKLQKKLHNKKYFSHYKNFYSINNLYYSLLHPSSIDFKSNFIVEEHYSH